MAQKIHKYPFTVQDYVTIEMPVGSQVLSVQTQRETPCVWVLVNVGAPMHRRRFRIVGTGQPLDDDLAGMRYVGTFQLVNGDFVGHLFEDASQVPS